MRTIDAESILRGIVSLTTGVSALPDTEEFPTLRGHLDLSLQEAWESEFWTDLMRTEQRFARDIYTSPKIYNPGDEVYYPASKLYYQCVQLANGNVPATLSGSTWTTNVGYWALSASSYGSTAYDPTKVYVAGDQVLWNDTGLNYQAITATTGNPPSDEHFWGPLAPFDFYIPFEQSGQTAIGEVMGVFNASPRLSNRWKEYGFSLSENGVQIPSSCQNYVWIHFRTRRPSLIGDAFDETLVYKPGAQIFFTPTGGRGNWYDCLAQTSAGNSPTSVPESWALVEIPYIFAGYLTWAVYAKWLVGDGQGDKADGAMKTALGYLALESDKLFRQQSQSPSLPVRTY